MSYRLASIFLLALLPWGGADAAPAANDVWAQFRPLIGTWTGMGTTYGDDADVTHKWEFTIQDKFVRLHSTAKVRKPAGDGAVFEDVGFVSVNTDKSTFAFRQFMSKGFVNTYDLTVVGGKRPSIMFGPRECEGGKGMRVRMQLQFRGDDEYVMIMETAGPEQPFVPSHHMKMKRMP